VSVSGWRALPLIPPKLADPFWLLAFTGAFCINGFLALLAVLLLAPLLAMGFAVSARRSTPPPLQAPVLP
jgi:hypothetical protein